MDHNHYKSSGSPMNDDWQYKKVCALIKSLFDEQYDKLRQLLEAPAHREQHIHKFSPVTSPRMLQQHSAPSSISVVVHDTSDKNSTNGHDNAEKTPSHRSVQPRPNLSASGKHTTDTSSCRVLQNTSPDVSTLGKVKPKKLGVPASPSSAGRGSGGSASSDAPIEHYATIGSLFPLSAEAIKLRVSATAMSNNSSFVEAFVYGCNPTHFDKKRVSTSTTEAFLGCRTRLAAIVKSNAFELFCAGVIVFNAVLMGSEAEYLTRNYERPTPRFMNAQKILNIWYIIEWILRLLAHGKAFCIGEERSMNLIDSVLVLTTVLDLMFESGSEKRVFQAFRILRMVRLFRIYRQLRNVREFRKMISALIDTALTLFWAFVLMCFLIYSFAVLFTEGLVEEIHANDGIDNESKDALRKAFGSLSSSLYLLFQCICQGAEWGTYCDLLWKVHWLYGVLFLVYVFLSIFGVINVIVAVFVDSACESTQRHKDLLILEQRHVNSLYAKHVRDIFRQVDTDNSGTITMRELTKFLADEKGQLQAYFEALGLQAYDGYALFKLLDLDGEGNIDIDEFCDGCQQLKGEARSFDIYCIMYEMRKFFKRLYAHNEHIESLLHQHGKKLSKLATSISALSRMQEKSLIVSPLPSFGTERKIHPPSSLSIACDPLEKSVFID